MRAAAKRQYRIGRYRARYWINDPYHYRLPAAYGSYRWVRYYGDILLVDTYNSCVANVIHDFFYEPP